MLNKLTAGIFVLMFLVGSIPQAQADFTAGSKAYQSGDYAKALSEWKPLAEKGDAAAQRQLGEIYKYGKGVQRNFETAFDWYSKAAHQGDPSAQFELGAMYEDKQDYQNEALWLRKAAAQGHVDAMSLLGVIYLDGIVPGAKGGEAVKWFTAAAKHKDLASLFLLGHMYAKGMDVKKDLIKAYMWFSIALEYNMLKATNARNALVEKMSGEEVATAKKLTSEWLKAQN